MTGFDPQAWKANISGPPGDVETMSWMQAYWRPAGDVIRPGLTAGEWVQFLSRPPTPEHAVYHSGLQYGTAGERGRPLKLYMYARANPDERRPGVVFIHGGGWHNLHPFIHIRHANHLAAKGYVTATISYRLYPEATIADAVSDAKCAVRWMRSCADRLGLDATRIGVAGGSAGGHLAAMVATSPGTLEGKGGQGEVSSAVQAAVLLYPVTDMRLPGEPTSPHAVETTNFRTAVKTMVGDEALLTLLSPVTHVSTVCPPILTVSGDEDALIPVPMLQAFHRRLADCGVENDLRLIAGQPHAFDMQPPQWQHCYKLMAEFFERHLGPAQCG